MILGLWGSQNTLIFTVYSLIVISSNSLQLRAFRNIRPLPCVSKSTGGVGVCMFAWDCMKNNGTHLGTCIDRFYFGSCCVLPGKETELSNEVIPLPSKKPLKPVSVHVWLENSSPNPPSSVSPQVNTQLNVILPEHIGTTSSTPQYTMAPPGTISAQTKISEVATTTIPTSSQGTNQIYTQSFSTHVTKDDGVTLATTLALPASASSTLQSTDASTSTNTPPTTDPSANPSTASSTAEVSPATSYQTTVTTSNPLSTAGNTETDIASTVAKTTQTIEVSTTQSTTLSSTENTPAAATQSTITNTMKNTPASTPQSTIDSTTQNTPSSTTQSTLDSTTQNTPSSTTQSTLDSTTQSTPSSTTQSAEAGITPISTTEKTFTNGTDDILTITTEGTSTEVALVADVNSTSMTLEITTFSPSLNSSLSNDVTDYPTVPPNTIDMQLDISTEVPTKSQDEILETTTMSMKPLPTTTIASLSTLANVTMSATDSVTLMIDDTTIAPAMTTTLDPSDYRQVCGKQFYSSGRIVGGAKAEFGEWPWQVSLRQWRGGTFLHKCGAALLNENWVITAAHCVENIPPDEILLRLGEYDLGREDEPYGYVEKKVQIIASHPQFESRTFEYDLALLRFFEPVKFQPNIIPICVPETDYSFVGDHGYVTGWGRLYEDGPLPSVLQEVSVPVVNNSICEDMYRSAGYIESIPHIFLCAGTFTGGMDSCEGDSGGPLVIQMKNGKWYLAGIISWGIGCAEPNQPGVYTRISEFRDWINQILQF